MRTVKIEHLRPAEILEEQRRRNIIYFTSGPLEWHSLHNPYGTDGFLFYEQACLAAEKTGGVVLPPFYMGADQMRTKEHLEKFGFEDTNQQILGMNFPNHIFKSFYLPAEVVVSFIRSYVYTLIDLGYKLIVILGHGGNQALLTEEMCRQITAEGKATVIQGGHGMGDPEIAKAIGHANITETSLNMINHLEDVDLSQLPPRDVKLKYCDWGILDRTTVLGQAPEDHCVINDPRDATREYGIELQKKMVDALVAQVNKVYSEITGD